MEALYHLSPGLGDQEDAKDLRAVLYEGVKIVNLIESLAMNSRLFSVICNEMGAHFKQLLFHSEVRWLSRSKVLARLYDLREEARLFLSEISSPLLHHMEDMNWVAMFAYLSDISAGQRLQCLFGTRPSHCIQEKN